MDIFVSSRDRSPAPVFGVVLLLFVSLCNDFLSYIGGESLDDTNMSNTPNRQEQTTGCFAGQLSQPEPSVTDINASPSDPNAEGLDTKYCSYSFVGLRREDQFWTTKESLCDVELDASSTELLNIRDVMTSLPDDPAERARVHWRAVPSLREIWELERRRMASLLSTEDDFLNSAPDDEEEGVTTLQSAAKDGPSLPGSRLALRGSKRLYDPSPGLEDDYRRALGDIATRHSNFVQRVDSAFKGDGPAVFSPKTQAQTDSLGLSTPSSSQDEALAALNALGEQFGGDFEQINLRSQVVAQASQLSSLSPQTPNSRLNGGSLRSSPLSQVAPLTQADIEEIQEATAFGHSLERGESVLGDLTAGSPSADPFTLTPHENEYDSDEDVFHEEEKLGEEGFARSLSMLATQQPSVATDEHKKEKGDGEDIEVWDIASQMPDDSADGAFDGGVGNFLLSQADRAIETIREEDACSLSIDEEEDGRFHASNEDDIGDDLSDANAIDKDCTLYQESQERCSAEMSSESEKQHEVISSIPQCTTLRKGEYVLPQNSSLVPRRGDCNAKNAKGWHAVHKTRGRPQPWLRLCPAYKMESREEEVTLTTLFCSNHKKNVFVEPVRRPPSSHQARTWLKKMERKEKDSLRKAITKDIKKKRKRVELVIDDNTRKLVAASAPNTSQKKRRVAFSNDVVHQSSCQVFQVEEIQVESTSNSQMSQSPYQSQSSLLSLSQDEEDTREDNHQGSSSQKDGANNFQSPLASMGSQGSAGSSRQTEGVSSVRAYSAFDPSCTMGHGEGVSPLSAADALEGIGQQGGKIHVAGGGGLKGEAGATSTNSLPSAPTPLSIFSIEVHVQCRTGKAGAHDSKTIAMRPDPSRDKVAACVYLYARDPGGGEAIEILERGVLFTPVEAEIVGNASEDINRFVRKSLGISIDRAKVEMLRSERQLLLRLASIVKYKDPDALMSWDTQGAGLGYLIERGVVIGKGPAASNNGDANENNASRRGKEIDMVKLLGRIIKKTTTSTSSSLVPHEQQQEGGENGNEWSGSGLGSDWDERVGAGAAAASIVSVCLFISA